MGLPETWQGCSCSTCCRDVFDMAFLLDPCLVQSSNFHFFNPMLLRASVLVTQTCLQNIVLEISLFPGKYGSGLSLKSKSVTSNNNIVFRRQTERIVFFGGSLNCKFCLVNIVELWLIFSEILSEVTPPVDRNR